MTAIRITKVATSSNRSNLTIQCANVLLYVGYWMHMLFADTYQLWLLVQVDNVNKPQDNLTISNTKNDWECYFLFSLYKHGIIIMPMYRSIKINCFWLHESCFVTQAYHQNSIITTLSLHDDLQYVISTITQINS